MIVKKYIGQIQQFHKQRFEENQTATRNSLLNSMFSVKEELQYLEDFEKDGANLSSKILTIYLHVYK